MNALRESLRQAIREHVALVETQLVAAPERRLPDFGIIHQLAALHSALRAIDSLEAPPGDATQSA